MWAETLGGKEVGRLDTALVAHIAAELAPKITDARIVTVRRAGDHCLVLGLDATETPFLVATTLEAMPLLLSVAELPVEQAELVPDASPLSELAGATVRTVAADGTSVLLGAERSDAAGRVRELTLVVDLGRRPRLSLRHGRPHGSPSTERERRAQAATTFRPTVAWRRDRHGRPHVTLSLTGPGDLAGHSRSFDSINAAAAFAFREFWRKLELERRRAAVRKAAERELGKKLRAVAKVEAEVADGARAAEYRHKAELLLMRQSDIKRGVTTVRVTDYDNATPVEIEVDPRLTPAKNAERLFRRARKAERRAERAPVRLAELEREIDELRETLEEVRNAPAEKLDALERLFHPQAAAAAKRAGERVRFRTYTVSGGWTVLVGKSNRDNDILTHKIARPDDIWFHARQVPGSHVVLRRAGRKAAPDARAIKEAAAIAAFHSKAGKSTKVPVCYTERRYVRKPRGAKPGLAAVSREKVIYVDPGLPDRRSPT